MKYYIDNSGSHVLSFNNKIDWIITKEEILDFQSMVNDWKAESEDYAPIDYEFCYVEVLDWFVLVEWHKLDKKVQKMIIDYLTQIV